MGVPEETTKLENRDLIRKNFGESSANLAQLSQSESVVVQLDQMAEIICRQYAKGGSLFVAGNGGSAADSQHLVAELVSKLSRNRTPIRAFALTVDTSILTAIGNDYGFEKSFSRQVVGLMRPNDVFLGITTSGQSPNILEALKAVKEIGATSLLLTGRDGGRCLELADSALIAPGKDTGKIQEAHLIIYHCLCELIERGLIERGLCRYV